jgi:4-diphosphocytidyl-2-C-methyl-D-erythritol kinase
VSEISLRAFAKVNYALEVRGTRPDGYHEISTVLQSISLSDELRLERTRAGFDLLVEPEVTEVGPPHENTVHKAWRLLGRLVGEELPVRARLHKRVAAGAGLGGGSADAAAALLGLNELFGLGLSAEELREVGLRIGADVPFCLAGGTSLGEGIGEVLTSLPAPPPHALVVAKPEASADTARIYRAYDRRPPQNRHPAAPVVEALRTGDLRVLACSIGNDLTPVTRELVPGVGELEDDLLRSGALGAAMSGTGSAVYGVFGSEEEARVAANALRTPFAAVCAPVGRGVEVLQTLP